MNANATPSPYDAAIEDLENKIRQYQALLESLKMLRSGADGSPLVFTSGASRDSETAVRHDTFFGMTIGDAAKKFLGMVKATKSTSDIAEALERGGLKHSSKDFNTTVRSILGPREDFTRVPNGDWGLAEWYPGQGRGKAAKKATPAKAKKKAARKSPKVSPGGKQLSSEPKPKTLTAERPQERIEQYQSNHPGATAREISDALGIRIQTVGLILGKKKSKAA